MGVTILLSIMMMAGLFLMLLAGVGFIQDKRFFTSAPKEVQDAVLPRQERFPGAHALGWLLGIVSVALMLGAVVIGAMNGIQEGFGFLPFFIRFFVMIILLKAFDILFFDWFLLCHSGFGFFQYFYPETKEVLGLHLFGYNKKSHIIQVILFTLVAILLAWICTVI